MTPERTGEASPDIIHTQVSYPTCVTGDPDVTYFAEVGRSRAEAGALVTVAPSAGANQMRLPSSSAVGIFRRSFRGTSGDNVSVHVHLNGAKLLGGFAPRGFWARR